MQPSQDFARQARAIEQLIRLARLQDMIEPPATLIEYARHAVSTLKTLAITDCPGEPSLAGFKAHPEEGATAVQDALLT